MRTKLIDSSVYGNCEIYYYKCMCGKGRIVEDHDNTPGFREHTVYIDCEECSKLYKIDESNGVRQWELVHK